MESVEQGAPGDAGVKTVKRERERSSRTVTAVRARNQTWATSVDTRVEHGGKHRVPTDHVDSRGADDNGHPAVVLANFSNFKRRWQTILQAARNKLEEQVQNATSTTTDKEPIRADRLFKLRSYLGAVDQRNELELTTSEESSTPRLIRALSAQMYYILVMMKTLDRCRNASVSEEFARKRQFVREWEPRFVGLLRNVLSCRRKDDVPTQLPETLIDDIMTDVNVLRMEDGRVEACTTWESTGIASCIQVRKENLEITRTQQYIDSNLVPVQIGVQPKSKGQDKKTAIAQGSNRLRK